MADSALWIWRSDPDPLIILYFLSIYIFNEFSFCRCSFQKFIYFRIKTESYYLPQSLFVGQIVVINIDNQPSLMKLERGKSYRLYFCPDIIFNQQPDLFGKDWIRIGRGKEKEFFDES